METGQPGDCRRSTQIVADSRRHSYDYFFFKNELSKQPHCKTCSHIRKGHTYQKDKKQLAPVCTPKQDMFKRRKEFTMQIQLALKGKSIKIKFRFASSRLLESNSFKLYTRITTSIKSISVRASRETNKLMDDNCNTCLFTFKKRIIGKGQYRRPY